MKCAVCVLDKVNRPARAETTWQGTALCATHLEAWVAVDPLGTFRPNGCSRACSEMHTFEPPCQLAPDHSDGHEFTPDDLSDHGWLSYTCAVCGKRKADHSDGEVRVDER